MIMRNGYPYSPPSESDLASTNTSPEAKTLRINNMADDEDSMPPLINTKFDRVQGAVRRARAPPRNEHNQMYCDHVNCSGKNQTFKRVCEWNKHMDRHERPYKCREAGCELNPGFTYSGGLLRHQREVHKMHLSTKMPLFCPFENCNRSSGTGFTRKENLEEHKRRRHLEELSDHRHAASPNRSSSHPPAPGPASTTMTTGVSQDQHQHQHQQHAALESMYKRRRISTATEPDDAHQHHLHHHPHQQHHRQHQRLEPSNPNPSSSTVAMTMTVNDTAPVAIPPPPSPTTTSGVAESELVRWLRAEIQRKDEMIVRHATELHRLQNMLCALPPQTVYGVMQSSRLPGGGVG